MEQKQTVFILLDVSGSTGNNQFYHKNTKNIVDKNPNTNIIIWDDKMKVISNKEFINLNNKMIGYDGTSPSCLIPYIKKNNINDKIILITDGQVDPSEINKCETLHNNIKWSFSFVEVHLIHTGGTVNMSVSCPFTRYSPHIIMKYEKNKEPQEITSINKNNFEILSNVQNIVIFEDFIKYKEELNKTIIAQCMGININNQLKEKLIKLKKNMIFDKNKKLSEKSNYDNLNNSLKSNQIENAITIAKNIIINSSDEEFNECFKQIDIWIGMCEGSIKDKFDNDTIKQIGRIQRATNISSMEIDEVDDIIEEENNILNPFNQFECPISFSPDELVIMINDTSKIYENLDKNIINDIINCPLKLFKYKDLVENFISIIDHGIGLNSIKEIKKNDEFLYSPYTRKNITGFICISNNESSIKMTNWTFSNIFFGNGKLPGNQDLWFACFYLLVKNGKIPYLKDYLINIENHMKYRLENHKTFISLSGNSNFQTKIAPLNIACWYVVNSPCIEKNSSLFQFHIENIEYLYQLCELSGFPISSGIDKYIIINRALLYFLNYIKTDEKRLKIIIDCLQYDYIETGNKEYPYILVDGKINYEKQKKILKNFPDLISENLSIDEIIGLCSLVKPNLSAGKININYDWKPDIIKVNNNYWNYNDNNLYDYVVPINENTCRPLYNHPFNKIWKDEAKNKHEYKLDKVFSAYETFIRFINKFEKYPTLEDYLIYSSKSNNTKTLPKLICSFYNDVIRDYQHIINKIEPKEFKKRAEASIHINNRINIEKL